jgi:DUF1680 family protein
MFLVLTLQIVTAQTKDGGYPIAPVPFTSVKVTDAFWGQRLKASLEVTILLALSKCEETRRYENFFKAANPSTEYVFHGLGFDDTDIYKTLKGASYSMQTCPDRALDAYIDSVLVIVAAAQEPDGYLFTARTMNPTREHRYNGSKRWEKVKELSHEFYKLGHMIEGAVAHYQATGKRSFLDIAIKYADCVEREIGDAPGKQVKVLGHQIAEMALAKLYLVTGEKKYLDLAKFFLDKRGYTFRKEAYSQSHKPVTEQDEAMIQPVDTWFINRKLGILFETNVGKGKILVCSADIISDWVTRPVARQLYYSIAKYMNSHLFIPEHSLDISLIEDIMKKEGERLNIKNTDAPDELKNVIL